LAVGQDIVATATADSDRGRTIVKFASLRGATPEPVELAFVVVAGVFAGDELIVAGGVADPAIDTGVVAIHKMSGATRSLTETGPTPAGWADATETVIRSTTGDTLVAALCRPDRCRARILSLPSGAQTDSLDVEGLVRLSSDNILITGSDPPSRISAVSVKSGQALWSLDAEEFQAGYLTSDSWLIQSRLVDREGAFDFEVARIDLASGAEKLLFSASANDGFVLWPTLSNDHVAVLGMGSRLEEAGLISSSTVISTLDLQTGELHRDVFTLTLYE
jgi:hypothetical protein